MRSQTWFSSYSRWTITGLAVLVFAVVTPAHAQVACKLLQPAELESALKEWALGGKATQFSGSPANSGGTAFDICHSEIVRPGQGNLQVRVGKRVNGSVHAPCEDIRWQQVRAVIERI